MKLNGPLSINVIRAMRGIVDFYYWKGLPVARAWPKNPHQPNTVAQLKTKSNMSRMHTWLKACPNSWFEQWNTTDLPPRRSAEDLRRKIGLWLANVDLLALPPDVRFTTSVTDPFSALQDYYVYCQPYDGFDPAKIRWKIKLIEDGGDKLEWFIHAYFATRENFTKYAVNPNPSGWGNPQFAVWRPEKSAYQIRVGRPPRNWGFMPVPEDRF